MTAQIVEIAGRKMAVLPAEEYERLLDLAEDKVDSDAAEAAKLRGEQGEEYIPAELLDRILGGESALRVWRKYRGLTQQDLAERANTTNATISRMEDGKQLGNLEVWRSAAKTLNLSVEDIFPFN
jgi:DNA-binding XRE family transcriptional regulator